MTVHGSAVHRFCLHFLRNEDLADEALQRTFISAHKSLDSFEGRSSEKTWLFGIARNRCLDVVRQYRRTQARTEQLPEEGNEPEDPRAAADATAQQNALRRVLDVCIDKLNPKVRAAVLLRFREEMSYVDMESALGEARATLQMRVTRAMPVLRRCVESHGMAL